MFKFEWDDQKAASSLLKHGVSFDEVVSVFGDAMALTFADTDHTEGEDRSRTYGISNKARLFMHGSNVVVLQPEIQKAFPTSDAVNKALASMLAFAQETQGLTGRSSRTPRSLNYKGFPTFVKQKSTVVESRSD